MSSRLGIDIGKTYTDLLLVNDSSGQLYQAKTPTTVANLATGVVSGLQTLLKQSGIAGPAIKHIIHSSTIAADLVLDGNGPRLGLLVTENFEQVLHLARGQAVVKSRPLLDLQYTRGITERINAQGEVLTPLNEEQAHQAIKELLAAGVEGLVISLLHAFSNPTHEQRLKTLIEEHNKVLPVLLASQLSTASGEYERTLLTVINAYTQAGVRHYCNDLEMQLKDLECTAKLHYMAADGQLLNTQSIIQTAVKSIHSGTAATALGAAAITMQSSYPNALSFALGGSAVELAVIQNGKPRIAEQTTLADYVLEMPAIETITKNIGGSSSAYVAKTGALRIGPPDAGQASVNDANIVLGRLSSDFASETTTAAVTQLAQMLELDVQQAAQGIVDLINEHIVAAMRLLMAQKGLYLNDYALLVSGGAGPLHGNAIAMLTGCFPVLVPPQPGVLSALGLLQAQQPVAALGQKPASGDVTAAVVAQQRVYFDTGLLTAAVYDRSLLQAGHCLTGPALITQADATTLLHPRHVATIDASLNILITPQGEH